MKFQVTKWANNRQTEVIEIEANNHLEAYRRYLIDEYDTTISEKEDDE